jgi:hypothetical protein
LRKSSDKGPIPRRLRFGAPQESDFQRLGKNTKRFNPAGNRSNNNLCAYWGLLWKRIDHRT